MEVSGRECEVTIKQKIDYKINTNVSTINKQNLHKLLDENNLVNLSDDSTVSMTMK